MGCGAPCSLGGRSPVGRGGAAGGVQSVEGSVGGSPLGAGGTGPLAECGVQGRAGGEGSRDGGGPADGSDAAVQPLDGLGVGPPLGAVGEAGCGDHGEVCSPAGGLAPVVGGGADDGECGVHGWVVGGGSGGCSPPGVGVSGRGDHVGRLRSGAVVQGVGGGSVGVGPGRGGSSVDGGSSDVRLPATWTSPGWGGRGAGSSGSGEDWGPESSGSGVRRSRGPNLTCRSCAQIKIIGKLIGGFRARRRGRRTGLPGGRGRPRRAGR
ncbi:hypothetical protein SAMN04489713_11540 [Actinomadura madurae]|uniref:Uncharacterized protein n=1 Tax=Actinomadura madurae TaxID=1993 RepID=A0A1I5R9Z1_9ACTN|nr:hypothetical protein SAMN04489713_11540 [Actinomadura madurae]